MHTPEAQPAPEGGPVDDWATFPHHVRMPANALPKAPPPLSHSSPITATVAILLAVISAVAVGAATYSDAMNSIRQQGQRIDRIETDTREERRQASVDRSAMLEEVRKLQRTVDRLETKLDNVPDVRRANYPKP